MNSAVFVNELQRRRFEIVKLFATIFLAGSLLAVVLDAYGILSGSLKRSEYEIFLFIGLACFVLFAFIRTYLVHKALTLSFAIIVALLTIAALYTMLVGGTTSAISFLLMTISVLSISIVISVKIAFFYIIISSICTFSIFLLHNKQIIDYTPSLTDSGFANTLMYITSMLVITYVAGIAYSQIEHSYQKAYDYAKELEELNKHLDEKVRLRTKQLQESLERQADSVHSAAVMGSIAKPMLHDLATPLSSLAGAQSLLKKVKFDQKTHEIIEMSNQAVSQIARIVENARNLMDNKNLVVEFSPYDVISVAILVSKHELQRDNITVNVRIDPMIKLNGVVGIFERMVINLIINAVEELGQCESDRRIDIKGNNEGKYFVLKIKDSGRGIKREFIDRIFDSDFTMKSERNLGFGLPFVRNSIEKNFAGDISVRSKLGEFTEFTLRFDRKFNARKIKKGKKNKEFSVKK
ncbi:hypothetical protein JW796_01280 [Candidatus Dojkabacteria bacterium]|nr:hypothetical protein [Candidatus Dojkabacteria bacterium]